MAPEQGHVRIGNRLYEAIISAPLTNVQRLVVLAILRLTLGWNRRSVNASHAELAKLIGKGGPRSGAFRNDVSDLVREGVIVLVSDDGKPNGYGIHEDFEQWGRFSQSAAKLEALWGRRPEHMDQLPLQILTLHTNPASPQAGSLHKEQATPPAERQGPRLPAGGPPASPQAGSPTPTADTSASSGVGKTLKDIEKQLPPQPPTAGGRGEAMELLTQLVALKEDRPDGSAYIRLDRVREKCGPHVAAAVKLLGGTGRVLATKPEHHGILVSDLAQALARVRTRAERQETGT